MYNRKVMVAQARFVRPVTLEAVPRDDGFATLAEPDRSKGLLHCLGLLESDAPSELVHSRHSLRLFSLARPANALRARQWTARMSA